MASSYEHYNEAKASMKGGKLFLAADRQTASSHEERGGHNLSLP
jgi:hypothetical protein